MTKIKIIGGGLAGCECAYQLALRGYEVSLYEMRPTTNTPIHKTAYLAELVCSNSLKSNDVNTSQGLLKAELETLSCMILRAARKTSVPAGGALAVDRKAFSQEVENEIAGQKNITIVREEVTELSQNEFIVVATGPLTSDKLAESIIRITGCESLSFYDAVAPIITAESVDKDKSFFAGRYGKGGEDYLNCPMTKEEYYEFANALITAEKVILKDFEKKDVFSACMPIEVMAERGIDSMRFGPLRPVGIRNPVTGIRPYAVVQLRKEDNYDNLYNIVGFQTNLKFGEQKRVFGMIPALKDAEYVRYGVMHRNTFVNAPKVINSDFSAKNAQNIYFAGQISGVEGYLESTMSGLMTAINIDRKIKGKEVILPSENTAIGSLIRYIVSANDNFQPMHVSYSLMSPLQVAIRDKSQRKQAYSQRALNDMHEFVRLIKE